MVRRGRPATNQSDPTRVPHAVMAHAEMRAGLDVLLAAAVRNDLGTVTEELSVGTKDKVCRRDGLMGQTRSTA
jgi:hypothetical protein